MKVNFNFFKKKKEESIDRIDELLKNESFNSNSEEINPDDDIDISDYTLDDRKNITTGLYLVLESNIRQFQSFDKIYVEDITEKGLIIRFEEETEKNFYDYNSLKGVTVAKDENFDKQFE
jgi:hypothetical protein